jgi:hypothetical protein
MSEPEIKRLWAEYCGKRTSLVKAAASKKNGAKGGRPMNYLQSLYDAIPASISLLEDKLSREGAQTRFKIQRIDTANPTETGFDITCDDLKWHYSWNRASDFIAISENGKKRAGINRINYSAKRAAVKLIQDIHREKLMSMPEDYSQDIQQVEQETNEAFNPEI